MINMDVSEVSDVKCDECDEVFKIRLIEKPHPGKIIETFFRCPCCKHKYVSFVTDEWARQEQRKIAKLHDELIKRKGRLGIRVDQLKKQIASQ